MWDTKFNKGDLGGNLFSIKFNDQINELHAFWDAGAGVLQTDPKRPLNAIDFNELLRRSYEIMAEWPRSRLLPELNDKDYSDWCLESYLEAVNYAYNGAQLNQQLTQDYIDRAWLVVKKKIALGGYRLADILSKLY